MILRPGRQGRRAGLGTIRAGEYSTQARGAIPPSATVGLWRGDSAFTLGSTPVASGTTPPVVTLTGSLVITSGLYIKIDGAGTLGIATFRWSRDNGSTFVQTGVLTAATVVLTGAEAGITVNFPAGAYLTDNIYRATVAQWNDLSGNNRHILQATASLQPLLIVTGGPNNQACITADGVDDAMNAAFVYNQPATIYIVVKYTSAFAAADTLLDGGGGVGNRGRFYRSAAQTMNAGNPVLITGVVNTTTSWHYYCIAFNGVSSAFYQDNNLIVSGDTGAGVLGGLHLFSFAGGGSNAAASIAEIRALNIIPTSAQNIGLVAGFKARYLL